MAKEGDSLGLLLILCWGKGKKLASCVNFSLGRMTELGRCQCYMCICRNSKMLKRSHADEKNEQRFQSFSVHIVL